MARSNREPAVIGSDASDAFYIGRFWHEQTGFIRPRIGPKMQMPGAEPGIVIGAPRMGKIPASEFTTGCASKGKVGSSSVIAARLRRSVRRGGARSARSTMAHQFGQLTDHPGYEDLASDGWCMLGGHDP